MRPPVKHRLGIDYDAVRAANPRIVYGSISGFGQDGPHFQPRRSGPDRAAHERPDERHGGAGKSADAAGSGDNRSLSGPLPGRRDTGRASRTEPDGRRAVGPDVAARGRDRDARLSSYAMDHRPGGSHAGGEPPPTVVPMGCFKTADGYINIAAYGGRLLQAVRRGDGAAGAARGQPVRDD
jgi:crotonobetainyl-CoA:carnitine CoA-transferase CaiB-like acyl-CoA transferase